MTHTSCPHQLIVPSILQVPSLTDLMSQTLLSLVSCIVTSTQLTKRERGASE